MIDMPSDMNGLLKSITRSRSDVIVMGAIAISASCAKYKIKCHVKWDDKQKVTISCTQARRRRHRCGCCRRRCQQNTKTGRLLPAISWFSSEQNVDSKTHQIVRMKNRIASSIQLHVNGTFPPIIQFCFRESVRFELTRTDTKRTETNKISERHYYWLILFLNLVLSLPTLRTVHFMFFTFIARTKWKMISSERTISWFFVVGVNVPFYVCLESINSVQ